MTAIDYRQYQIAAGNGTISDDHNPTFLFAQTDKEILRGIINGKFDPVLMAKIEMINRGFDLRTGKWVGWKSAEEKVEELFLSA